MPVDNSLHRGEANASPLKFIRLVQALKDAEEFSYIRHVEARTIIPHENNVVTALARLGTDLNPAWVAAAAILQRI